jgi:periplasmic protein TonB
MVFLSRAVIAGLAAITVVAAAAAQEKPQVYKPGDGVTFPRLVKEFKPVYTTEAREAGIQGTVGLEAVVTSEGKVGDVRVTGSLDTVYGLDDEAVKCVKRWLFRPGTKDGKPVPVQVEIEISFTLRR